MQTRPKQPMAMPILLILSGVIPLAGALISQYGFDQHPCHFCLLQRYPYLVVIGMGALTRLAGYANLLWRFSAAVGIYALGTTAVLGMIHTAIERQWVTYTGGCVAGAAVDGSLEALRETVIAAPLVACDQPAAMFLGLSMASWNVLWAIAAMVFATMQYRYDTRRVYAY